ncbi:uncharacterized protein LOC133880888 [Alnus glutinosa]|uniref:uncharacterized protein LOC133880888 n=1 Tax=Alnus glutinosa TaxID=3517 RepID=UPI002D79CD42|nr:uncharacterized protein LOC133880888 [Alnus glutinosa]
MCKAAKRVDYQQQKMEKGIHFPYHPIEFIMPPSLNNVRDISIKTIPSASKPEIKKVLESVYSYEVEKVRTLNMKGKKKMRGGRLIAKPDYKKAYVTLKSPVSFSREFYPIRLVEEERKSINKKTKSSTIKE